MSSNPSELIEQVLKLVSQRYASDTSQMAPMVFACRDNEIISAVEMNFDNPMTKDLSVMLAGMFLQANHCDASVHVSEAWMSHQSADTMDDDDNYVPPSESPDRVEVLICEASTQGHYLSVVQKMERDERKELVGFSELHRVDSKEFSQRVQTVQSRFDFFNALKPKLDS